MAFLEITHFLTLESYMDAMNSAQEYNLYNYLRVINEDLKYFEDNKRAFMEKKDDELVEFRYKWLNNLLFYVKFLKVYNLF